MLRSWGVEGWGFNWVWGVVWLEDEVMVVA